MISFSFVKSTFLSLQGARRLIKKQYVAKETDKLIYLTDREIVRTRTYSGCCLAFYPKECLISQFSTK